MTTTELVNYVHAHSYPAWSDDDQTIHVVIPWVRWDTDGCICLGHDVQSIPATIADVQSLIGCCASTARAA